jgi:hypothetical protein
MRLLSIQDNGEFSLVEFTGRDTPPPYAILSHTWGGDDDEVSYQDIREGTEKSRANYKKLTFCGEQAKRDGLEYCWVDTCCIDKSSSQDVSEAIRSMFRLYKNADKCYVYLSDVPEKGIRWETAFKESRWFKRGWTLQELIAPNAKDLVFFSAAGHRLGDKRSLTQTIHEITRIPIDALKGGTLSQYDTDELMSWGKGRDTKREEDEIYSLLGLFDVHMEIMYSEGREKAWRRLQKHIYESSKPERLDLHQSTRAKENHLSRKRSSGSRSVIQGSAFGHNAVNGNYHGNVTINMSGNASVKRRRNERSPIENSKRLRATSYTNEDRGISKYPKGSSSDRESDDEGGTSSEDSERSNSGDGEEDSAKDSSEEELEEGSDGGLDGGLGGSSEEGSGDGSEDSSDEYGQGHV